MSARNEKIKFTPIDYKYEVSRYLRNTIQVNYEHYSDCPFCHVEAKHKKFAYTPFKSKSGLYNCFKCGESGTGYTLLKKLGFNFKDHTEQLPVEIKPVVEVEVKQKPLKPFYGNYTYNFIIKDIEGRELYQKHLKNSSEYDNKKGKYKKILTYSHLINDKRYVGKGEYNKPTFYGLESISKHTDTLFIVEGEKKRDNFITAIDNFIRCHDNFLTLKFSVISATLGSSQKIDERTLEAIKTRQVKKVIILPDLDQKGKEFAIENRSILLEHDIETYILDYETYLSPDTKVFSGYDIEDAIKDTPSIVKSILGVCQSKDELLKLQTLYFLDSDGVLRFKSKYITQSILPENIHSIASLNTKTFILKSLQGTGKTRYLELLREIGLPILYISPRVELCKDASQRINTPFYLDIDDRQASNYIGSLAVCINSLHKFTEIIKNIDKFVVCIDEIDHTKKDLMTSPLIKDAKNKEHRNKIYKIFSTLLKNSKYTYLTSADIPDFIYKYLSDIGIDNYLTVENSYKDKRNYIGNDLEAENNITLFKILSDNNKVSASVNDKVKAITLKYSIQKKYPEKKILFLEQAKTKDEARILESKDFSQYDVIIYTPTIFTGVDFNIEFSDYHFLYIYNNTTVNHYEALQSCYRFRNAKNIYFWIKKVKGKKTENIETIKDRALKRRNDFTSYGSLTSDIDYKMLDSYCRILAENNRSRNNLAGNFIKAVKERIENSSQFTIAKDGLTEAELDTIKTETKAMAVEVKTDKINSILSATRLDDKRMSELDSGSDYKIEQEKFDYIKTKYLNFTGLDEDSKEFENIVKIDLSSLVASSNLSKALLMPLEAIIEYDRAKNTGYLGDDDYMTLKWVASREILQTLIPDIKFDSKDALQDSVREKEIDKDRLSNVLIDDQTRERWSRYFNFTDSSETRGSYLMRSLFSMLGWQKTSRKVRLESGKRAYRYLIDTEFLSLLLSFGKNTVSGLDNL